MKKKNIIILLVIIGVGLLSLISIEVYKGYQDKIAKEKAAQVIENTKKEYAFYLKNQPTKKSDETSVILNSVIEESQKNDKINQDAYINTIFTDTKFNNKNIDTIITNIDKEIEYYKVETIDNFTEENLRKSIKSQEINPDTLVTIFNSHKFIKNLKDEKEKRNNYIAELTELKNNMNYFKEKANEFYSKNNKLIAKNDKILKRLTEFNDKYKLNINIKKEVLVVNKPKPTTNNISGKYVTILCYHGVLDNPWGLNELFVKVSDFDAQMKYLSENGYTTIFASEIANAGKYEKPVIITFDDGYADVYTNAFPILKKYNLKANVYMISGWINGDVYMTSAMTKEMSDSQLIEIGSHTVNHKALATLSDEEIDYELKTSKQDLENMIGKSVDVIAYPKGSFDSRVKNIASNYYKYSLSTIKGVEYPGSLNKYSLKRKYVYRKYNINDFASLFNNSNN